MSGTSSGTVDILILGAGWTSTFLIPLCDVRNITYAATSRPAHPKPNTIPFEFDETDSTPDPAQFKELPAAKTVLITFPIKVKGASERLIKLYEAAHEDSRPSFIQLGTTGIWQGKGGESVAEWIDRRSAYDKTNPRAEAEDELLALSPSTPTTVLNLSGLWGGSRSMKHVVSRVAPTKEALKSKTSLHMIHGEDVSRAILAVHKHFDKAAGQRWLLTDTRVHDWWNLASAWGDAHTKNNGYNGEQKVSDEKGPQPGWVRELMNEEGVRALPRGFERLGRLLDSRDFWNTFELEPKVGILE